MEHLNQCTNTQIYTRYRFESSSTAMLANIVLEGQCEKNYTFNDIFINQLLSISMFVFS